MSEGATLIKRPAWTLWLELVAREAKGQATIAEQQRVRQPDNLLSWLRALNTVKQDIEARIADSKLRLRALTPLPGQQATPEYIEEKRRYDQHHAGRVRVARSIDARIEECRYLIDQHNIPQHSTLGHLISAMCRAEELLCRDDIDGALGVLRSTLHRALKETA